MSEVLQPRRPARRRVLRAALGVALIATTGMHLARAAEGSQIVIDNFKFAPATLHVQAGTTVKWVNHDDIPHTIVVPTLNVRSHPMDTDDAFSYTFASAGTFNYVCGMHPFMHGQVIVSKK